MAKAKQSPATRTENASQAFVCGEETRWKLDVTDEAGEARDEGKEEVRRGRSWRLGRR